MNEPIVDRSTYTPEFDSLEKIFSQEQLSILPEEFRRELRKQVSVYTTWKCNTKINECNEIMRDLQLQHNEAIKDLRSQLNAEG